MYFLLFLLSVLFVLCQICVKSGIFKKKFAKTAQKKKKIGTFPVIKSSRGIEFFPLRKIGGFDEKTSKKFKEKGGDKMNDSIINETKVVPRNIVEYKKINPDYQIPLIYDRPFKAVCKTYKEFINKILIELLDVNPKSIEASYFVDAELPLEQHSSKKMITDLLLHVDDNFLIDVEAYSSFSAGNVIKGTNYAFRIVISEEVDGKNYKKLRLIQVNFIRGKYDAACNYLTEGFAMRSNRTNKVMKYTPEFVFVYLENVEEIAYNETRNWLYRALKMLVSSSIKETKILAGDDPILSKVAFFMKNYSNQYSNLMYINEQEEQEKVYNTDMALAAETGENKGRIEGQIAGEQKKQREMVENLLNLNVNIETISQASGLSIEEIQKIKETLENNN